MNVYKERILGLSVRAKDLAGRAEIGVMNQAEAKAFIVQVANELGLLATNLIAIHPSIDMANLTAGAVLPMIPDSWRYGVHNGEFVRQDNGPFVAWEAVKDYVYATVGGEQLHVKLEPIKQEHFAQVMEALMKPEGPLQRLRALSGEARLQVMADERERMPAVIEAALLIAEGEAKKGAISTAIPAGAFSPELNLTTSFMLAEDLHKLGFRTSVENMSGLYVYVDWGQPDYFKEQKS